ncbi:MAG: hypothetical protein ACI9XO_001095 [Paraglaciecola sp.]|jgi:hypothetical protein
MKKLSLLFAFVGFFAMTTVSAQNAKCCVLPAGQTCNAKAVKNCSSAEVASCKKMAEKGTCNKSATARAVAVKSVEKATYAKKTAAFAAKPACQKASNTATATSIINTFAPRTEGNTCGVLPVSGCSKAKSTSTGQLAEKMN